MYLVSTRQWDDEVDQDVFHLGKTWLVLHEKDGIETKIQRSHHSLKSRKSSKSSHSSKSTDSRSSAGSVKDRMIDEKLKLQAESQFIEQKTKRTDLAKNS